MTINDTCVCVYIYIYMYILKDTSSIFRYIYICRHTTEIGIFSLILNTQKIPYSVDTYSRNDKSKK